MRVLFARYYYFGPVSIGFLLAAVLMASGTTAAAAELHPGEAVYKKACAACHDNPETTKSPALSALQAMRPQTISYAMSEGKMRVQAAGLSDQEKRDLINYFGGQEVSSDWVTSMACPDSRKPLTVASQATVSGFGFSLENTRYLSAKDAGLTTEDLTNLELAWALAFPGATTMRSQPAVVGHTLFLPVADTAQLYAIDINGEPCLQWVYTNVSQLRSSAAFWMLDNKPVIAVGDAGANTHLIDATTGEKLWSRYTGVNPLSISTGTPVIHDGKVIVPVSQYEISVAGAEEHQCCTSHGAVQALDLASGEILWTYHTMPNAVPQRDRGDGVQLLGPSGAPIWNSPAIDVERGLVFVGTGESTSEPAHKNTDAIIAIDLDTGEERWSFQATANDIFVGSCAFRRNGLNCPKPEQTVARDVDFGASMILATIGDGRDVVLGGQKSGTVWALDRDTGELVWRRDIGEGSPLGGIHWGIAFDGDQVFAPINRPFGRRPGPGVDTSLKTGLYVLDANNGELNWQYQADGECDNKRAERVPSCRRNYGFSAAPTVIDNAVVTGSLDGMVRIFQKDSGKVLYQFDTVDSFDTINGVEAQGGAIDNGTVVASQGMLFVQSGYGMFGQMPGNVLLAFRPAK